MDNKPMAREYKKKCVIFSETYLPLLGGAEMYTYNFAKQLAIRGYAVTIFTNAEGEVLARYQIPGVDIVQAPKVSKLQFFAIASLFRTMLRFVRTSDLVFANYTYSLSTLAVIAGLLTRKKISVFAHGLGTIIDPTHPKVYHLYRFVTLRLAYRVIATSEELADIVRRYTKEVIVATAVDCSAIDGMINSSRVAEIRREFEGKKIILTVRRLVEKNGIQYLIEALPYAVKKEKNIFCIILGDGRLRRELEERVENLGLSSHVRFLGALQNDLVFNYIKAADVVVFPSSAEALSLAAIEVMHLGTPLVSSFIGGLRELVGLNGERGTPVDLFGRTESLYTAPDPYSLSQEKYEQFADCVITALSRSEDISQKVVEAKKFVDARFDWTKVADDILEFTA